MFFYVLNRDFYGIKFFFLSWNWSTFIRIRVRLFLYGSGYRWLLYGSDRIRIRNIGLYTLNKDIDIFLYLYIWDHDVTLFGKLISKKVRSRIAFKNCVYTQLVKDMKERYLSQKITQIVKGRRAMMQTKLSDPQLLRLGSRQHRGDLFWFYPKKTCSTQWLKLETGSSASSLCN